MDPNAYFFGLNLSGETVVVNGKSYTKIDIDSNRIVGANDVAPHEIIDTVFNLGNDTTDSIIDRALFWTTNGAPLDGSFFVVPTAAELVALSESQDSNLKSKSWFESEVWSSTKGETSDSHMTVVRQSGVSSQQSRPDTTKASIILQSVGLREAIDSNKDWLYPKRPYVIPTGYTETGVTDGDALSNSDLVGVGFPWTDNISEASEDNGKTWKAVASGSFKLNSDGMKFVLARQKAPDGTTSIRSVEAFRLDTQVSSPKLAVNNTGLVTVSGLDEKPWKWEYSKDAGKSWTTGQSVYWWEAGPNLTGTFSLASSPFVPTLVRQIDAAGNVSTTSSITYSPPTYKLVSTSPSFNEGGNATFTLTTTNVAAGTTLNYVIGGVGAGDIVGGIMAGSISAASQGLNTITVPILADRLTETLPESITLTVLDGSQQVAVASAIVNDTSKTPTYTLSGPATINEGSIATFLLKTTEVEDGAILTYTISGVTSADVAGGLLSGAITINQGNASIPINILSDKMTESAEVMVISISSAGQQVADKSVTINDTSKGAPSHSISAQSPSIDEGGSASFLITTKNVAAGEMLSYVISGVTAADISGGALRGSVMVNESGLTALSVVTVADKISEGNEMLTVTVGDASASVLIIDSYKATSYVITPAATAVNEGSTAKFTVTATGATAGSSVGYTLSGLNTEDVSGGDVSGRITLDDLGMATISVPIAADNKTEGNESLTVTVGSATSTITVNDTSKSTSQYYLSASDGIVSEGKVATFTVSAADAVIGTKIAYTVSGAGINAKDIANGKLSGSVAVGADGSATIMVPIAADKATEGDEDLTVALTGLGISETITVEDTSTAAPTIATYTLEAIESSVKEGEAAEFLLETTGVTAGTKLKYTITGVSNADLAGKKLTGTVEVGEDGTATITIPTATDELTEGTETLTLTVNGQKASVALLDDNSVKVSALVLEGAQTSLYKVSLGGYVLAAPGLKAGDALDDSVPLKASAIKDYALPKGLSAVLAYEDGSFGLIIKAGTGSKASFSEQKFSEDGIAKGKLAKLTAAQVLAKETLSDTDINGDGVIGDLITEIYDSDGDFNQQDYGLYMTSSGAVVLGPVNLAEGDTASTSVTLMASKTKGWLAPSGTSVAGIAITDGGSLEVLTLKGKQYSAQKFDPETGLIKGKATTLKTAQLDAREYYYNLDLTGDDDISLVGQETVPSGWLS